MTYVVNVVTTWSGDGSDNTPLGATTLVALMGANNVSYIGIGAATRAANGNVGVFDVRIASADDVDTLRGITQVMVWQIAAIGTNENDEALEFRYNWPTASSQMSEADLDTIESTMQALGVNLTPFSAVLAQARAAAQAGVLTRGAFDVVSIINAAV